MRLEEYSAVESPTPRFSVFLGKRFITSYSLDDARYVFLVKGIDLISIDVNGLDKQKIAQLWDKITLTNYEQEVLTALRIGAPGIEAISTVQSTSGERIPIVKVQGISEPIPLRSLGDGMQRMLGIVLALVNAQNSILLIDEIENGLHYSVQEDLWKQMFQIAHQLNVQIFATTHSWDCITAFQQAVQAGENEEGLLMTRYMRVSSCVKL